MTARFATALNASVPVARAGEFRALRLKRLVIDPPVVLFVLFCVYGLSGYVLYGWRKYNGQRASVISTSTDEPEESGLHK